MTKRLKILLDSDPILKQVAKPIEAITPALQELAVNMCATMISANGIGLAAPQIGESIRLIVFDTGPVDNKTPEAAIMFNPELLHGEGTQECVEQCLSLPGEKVKVERFKRINIKYQNFSGQTIIKEYTGISAIVVQHELDHLDGITLSTHKERK